MSDQKQVRTLPEMCDMDGVAQLQEKQAPQPQQEPLERAKNWLFKELSAGPLKCPLCNVIHSAGCPKTDWIIHLLASYELDLAAQPSPQRPEPADAKS
jgi:hypothetical protein